MKFCKIVHTKTMQQRSPKAFRHAAVQKRQDVFWKPWQAEKNRTEAKRKFLHRFLWRVQQEEEAELRHNPSFLGKCVIRNEEAANFSGCQEKILDSAFVFVYDILGDGNGTYRRIHTVI